MIKQTTKDPIPSGAKKIVNINNDTFIYFAGDAEVIEDERQRAEIAAQEVRYGLKVKRTQKVNQIKVTTTSGNIFDGDEKSQERMARAIVVMTDLDTINWVLADNTVIQASKLELTEALKLAGQAQANMWVIA